MLPDGRPALATGDMAARLVVANVTGKAGPAAFPASPLRGIVDNGGPFDVDAEAVGPIAGFATQPMDQAAQGLVRRIDALDHAEP